MKLPFVDNKDRSHMSLFSVITVKRVGWWRRWIRVVEGSEEGGVEGKGGRGKPYYGVRVKRGFEGL